MPLISPNPPASKLNHAALKAAAMVTPNKEFNLNLKKYDGELAFDKALKEDKVFNSSLQYQSVVRTFDHVFKAQEELNKF